MLFYTRDSGGKHETTPSEYVRVAAARAAGLGLLFDGRPESIGEMIRDGSSHGGDLFLDYDVKGNVLSRPGLDAMSRCIDADSEVSHVFVPRRDRLARPDHPADGLSLEIELRRRGVTILFLQGEVGPLHLGDRDQISELIVTLLDYEQAGKDRRQLAEKILLAQLSLAKGGFSTGGRPPFGFRRYLATVGGERVRELASGERVRMAGHHVVWLPVDDEHPDMRTIRRVLKMLETMPASRIAAQLTSEGIPTPDFGRTRKDNGIYHSTSGSWHANTITNIARNPLLRAVVAYGRRSMGDQLRYQTQGPRALTAGDFRQDGVPKIIRNDENLLITADARFDPLVESDRHDRLLKELDERGGTQRGKPRAQNPKANPLGGRVFDVACTWPMYRVPKDGGYRYSCGHYMQSHGAECRHNQVDGEQLTNFVLDAVRQKLLTPSAQQKLIHRIKELASQEIVTDETAFQLSGKLAELKRVNGDLAVAGRNLALAKSEAQLKAMASVFDELEIRRGKLEAEAGELQKSKERMTHRPDDAAAALAMFDRLPDLVGNVDDLAAIGEVVKALNLRVFLRFRQETPKKRTVNRVSSATITFGAEAPPIEPYQGPTGRRALQGKRTASSAVRPEGELFLPGPIVPIRRKSR